MLTPLGTQTSGSWCSSQALPSREPVRSPQWTPQSPAVEEAAIERKGEVHGPHFGSVLGWLCCRDVLNVSLHHGVHSVLEGDRFFSQLSLLWLLKEETVFSR